MEHTFELRASSLPQESRFSKNLISIGYWSTNRISRQMELRFEFSAPENLCSSLIKPRSIASLIEKRGFNFRPIRAWNR